MCWFTFMRIHEYRIWTCITQRVHSRQCHKCSKISSVNAYDTKRYIKCALPFPHWPCLCPKHKFLIPLTKLTSNVPPLLKWGSMYSSTIPILSYSQLIWTKLKWSASNHFFPTVLSEALLVLFFIRESQFVKNVVFDEVIINIIILHNLSA